MFFKRKKKVVYIPTIYQGDSDRAVVSEQRQYQWFKLLWKWFEMNKDSLDVVWKVGRFSHMEDPVRYWKADNIRYSDATLMKELKGADMALTDTHCASCVLDCAKADVPILVMIIQPDRPVALNLHDVYHVISDKTETQLAWLDTLLISTLKGSLPIRLVQNKRNWLSILRRDKHERQ